MKTSHSEKQTCIQSVLISFCIFLSCNHVNSQTWSYVGDLNSPTTTYVSTINSAVSSSGVPYIVYNDGNTGGKATVKKYTGSSWSSVGPTGFSTGTATGPNIAIDAAENLYVVYSDGAVSGKATVKKFNGSTWTNVGSAGFTTGSIGDAKIVLGTDGLPFVAFIDGANGNKPSVMKFNGTSWNYIGTAGFSTYQIQSISIAINSQNVPYVFYSEWNNNQGGKNEWHGVVKSLVGSTWTPLTISSGFGTWIYNTSIAIDNGNNILIGFSDQLTNNVYTEKFTGAGWQIFDTPNFGTSAYNSAGNIALDKNGNAYMPFIDGAGKNGFGVQSARVVKYNYNSGDTHYTELGTFPYTASNLLMVNLSLSSSGIPYICFRSFPGDQSPPSVMRFCGPPQPGNITGTFSNFCNGTSQVYSIPAIAGATSYVWQLPSGWTGSSTTNTINTVAGKNTGNISVTAKDGCGRSPVTSQFINVISTPVKPGYIQGSLSVCSNKEYMFSAATATGATSYLWSLPAGWTGSSTSNQIYVTTGSNGGNIYVKASNQCGTSDSTFITVRVDAPASSSSSNSQNVDSNGNFVNNNCGVISSVKPSGSNPVSGYVTTTVTIADTVPYYNTQPYVQRYYNIVPDANAATATGTITLYFTQQDFNNYNNFSGSFPHLPTGPNDSIGIGNIRIAQLHGTGTDPGNYSGSRVFINPDDSMIVWSNDNSRWEVTFNVEGFSGFYLQTIKTTVYSFVGSGNWNDPANWSSNTSPPSSLTPGSEIIIDPSPNGECIVNVSVSIPAGVLLTVKPGKKLVVNGNLTIEK